MKILLKYLIVTVIPFLFWSTSLHAKVIEVQMSSKKGEWNELVFDQKFATSFIPKKLGLVLGSKPQKINNNYHLLINFKEGTRGEYQFFAYMLDGERLAFRFIVSPDINGTIYPSPNAGKTKVTTRKHQIIETDKKRVIEVFKSLQQNKIPRGFNKEKPNLIIDMSPLLLVEAERFTSYRNVIRIFTVTSSVPVRISPEDFYNENVIAIQLDDSWVGKEPILVSLIERKGDENE